MRKILAPLFLLATCLFLPASCSDEKTDESECDLLTFRINAWQNASISSDIVFTVDRKNKTFNGVCLEWLEGDGPLELIPTFTYKGKEVTVSGKEQRSGITKTSFLETVEYTVTAEDGTKETFYVKLLSPQYHSQIPVFRIESDRAIESKKDYVPAKLEIRGNAEYNTGLWDFSLEKVGIRRRGNSTYGLPKKPYRIKFDSRYQPLGMEANAKSWVILANDCDKTLLRNAVAFETARYLFETPNPLLPFHEKTIKFVPSTVHVDVYLNGKYEGIYHFTDQVQQDKNRINVSDASSNLTGGYLLEVDIHNGGEHELDRIQTWIGTRMTRKYPGYDDDGYTDEHKDYIEDLVRTAEKVMFSDDFADPDEGWRKYWDEATAVDFFIVKEFAGDPDGFCSTYIYKHKNVDKFFFGPVWDFDSAYDNDKRTYNPRGSLMIDAGFVAQDRPSWFPSDDEWNKYSGSHWFKRLWQDQTFRLSVQARWNAVKDGLLQSALETIDRDVEKMGESVRANFARWDISTQALGDAMPPPASYEEGISDLKEYIRERYNFLNRIFNGG